VAREFLDIRSQILQDREADLAKAQIIHKLLHTKNVLVKNRLKVYIQIPAPYGPNGF
jgi:hypothetical protein